jgi:hypothetical protein
LRKWQAGLLFALVAITGASGGSAFGEEPAAQPQVKEQHALDLLKRMSDKLTGAKSFTFRSRSTIEAPGGTEQFLNFFANSEVALVRPNKLQAKVRGDAPPFDFYYDNSIPPADTRAARHPTPLRKNRKVAAGPYSSR